MYTIVYQDTQKEVVNGHTPIEVLKNLIEAINGDFVDTENRVLQLVEPTI